MRKRFWLSVCWAVWLLRLRGSVYSFAAGRYCIACGMPVDTHLYIA